MARCRIPGCRGSINSRTARFRWKILPNGLSQLHGTLEFNQNRLEVTVSLPP